jgi:sulfur relay (sulfurtransferase) complex TusBCD TusD component (DsrE family)
MSKQRIPSQLSDSVILISREGMGSGDLQLQRKLLQTYSTLLIENRSPPAAICFYADGVKLIVEGSPLLESLSQLEEQGVHLIVCATCLKHYGLLDQVRVGIVGGMGDILEAQLQADKVITL